MKCEEDRATVAHNSTPACLEMRFGFGVWGLGFGVWSLGFGVWGLGFGVWGLGFSEMLRIKSVKSRARAHALGRLF